MQFSVIGQWLMDGKSPHTGQPVTETCRIVKPGQHLGEYKHLIEVFSGTLKHGRTIYREGQTYAIQPGRGKKAIGRTPPLEVVYRQDVRTMTIEDARRRGFVGSPEYLMAWTKMHDPRAWNYAQCDLMARGYEGDGFDSWVRIEGVKWMRYLSTRPAERYQAWVLRFEASSGREAV